MSSSAIAASSAYISQAQTQLALAAKMTKMNAESEASIIGVIEQTLDAQNKAIAASPAGSGIGQKVDIQA